MTRSSEPRSPSALCSLSRADAFDVVLVTGTLPRVSGVGVERRAAQTLMGLARLGRVHVVYSGGRASSESLAQPLRALCSSFVSVGAQRPLDVGRWLRRLYLRAPRWPAPPSVVRGLLRRSVELEGMVRSGSSRLAASLPPARYVHVFRLAQLPLALPWLARADVRVGVDVDDLESDTLGALARLAASEHEAGLSWTFATMAAAARRCEEGWLPRVKHLAVCSERDRTIVVSRYPGAQVALLPNVYGLPESVCARAPRADVLRLLFVGALAYYPNVDALRFMVREVLPALRGRLPIEVELHVVGRGMWPGLRRELMSKREVTLHGELASLSPLYARSDVAVCPIRAGGGTRIKLLEAMAHGVPVVTTSVGAAGLAVAHGRELMMADDAADFARAVAELRCRVRGQQLALAAREFVLAHHGESRFDQGLRELAGRGPDYGESTWPNDVTGRADATR